ncbi:MlaA family lipoprotein [Pseudomonas cremoricolorata]|uniref:ABC transporter n=1 Tax=Pseudomonas cremoricolorata TaxID=157783 RepID=A0A089YDN5_9PSED|nr:VacJ family lipoprotein [Pseudomonas cremoricolorata]AIR89883.1 ABC transporter [Pseudomonas cremoricolorata]
MANRLLIITALLLAGTVQAAEVAPRTSVVEADVFDAPEPQPVAGPDGFLNPLRELKFNPGLDQREFERSTLTALNVYDPWESINRRIYHFNYRLDQWVLLPAVDGYRYVTPRFIRSGVTHFFENLGDVSNLFNSVLQLKGERAGQITARLLFNTIIGVGGLWDPASKMGLARQSEDFGQTLGFYGVPEGPYIMLPLFGPSNLRDTTGRVVDYVGEQSVNYLNVADASSRHPEIFALRALDKRYTTNFRYGQLNSPFEYEKVRYVYTQSRKLQIAE